jgi:hypothetical protein
LAPISKPLAAAGNSRYCAHAFGSNLPGLVAGLFLLSEGYSLRLTPGFDASLDQHAECLRYRRNGNLLPSPIFKTRQERWLQSHLHCAPFFGLTDVLHDVIPYAAVLQLKEFNAIGVGVNDLRVPRPHIPVFMCTSSHKICVSA